MSDTSPVKRSAKEKAETIIKMNTEAARVKRRINAESVIIIGIFKEGNQLQVQDAGLFPMPPDDFYGVMQVAHRNGQLGENSPKLKPTSRIIKPH